MSSRRSFFVGALLLVLLPLTALGLDGVAKKVRAVPLADGRPIRVIAVASAGELWQAYQGLALRGRLLLHLGRHLHYVPIPSNELYALDQGDVTAIRLSEAYRKHVSRRNYLWIAAYDGTFRTIHCLLPEDDFRAKATETGVGAQDKFTVYDSGFKRVIAVRPFLPGNERPVVHIDAAWLESHTPEEVVAMLRKLPARPDIITLSAAEDDDGTLPAARERLSRLKELLADGRL